MGASQLGNDDARREAYGCDVTYGTNNGGFDYLRDNLKFRLEDMVQRDFHFAIVDGSTDLIDSHAPLIISGPAESNSALYLVADAVIPQLASDDFDLDEKANSVTLTEAGIEHAEDLLRTAGAIDSGTLYDVDNVGNCTILTNRLKRIICSSVTRITC